MDLEHGKVKLRTWGSAEDIDIRVEKLPEISVRTVRT